MDGLEDAIKNGDIKKIKYPEAIRKHPVFMVNQEMNELILKRRSKVRKSQPAV